MHPSRRTSSGTSDRPRTCKDYRAPKSPQCKAPATHPALVARSRKSGSARIATPARHARFLKTSLCQARQFVKRYTAKQARLFIGLNVGFEPGYIQYKLDLFCRQIKKEKQNKQTYKTGWIYTPSCLNIYKSY